MFKIGAGYSEYYDANDPEYPGGKAVPASTPESMDGTNWRASWFNDLHGGLQALFIAAFGSLKKISNKPDTAFDSDFLRALQKFIDDKINNQYLVKNITGIKTVIPLSEIGISFDASKKYFIFVSPHGKFMEFLPFGAEINSTGLHIYAQRMINNEIIPGTRRKRWGDGAKWGDNSLWGEYGVMPVNILIKELDDDRDT
jgi:hypothetical protein